MPGLRHCDGRRQRVSVVRHGGDSLGLVGVDTRTGTGDREPDAERNCPHPAKPEPPNPTHAGGSGFVLDVCCLLRLPVSGGAPAPSAVASGSLPLAAFSFWVAVCCHLLLLLIALHFDVGDFVGHSVQRGLRVKNYRFGWHSCVLPSGLL